MTTRKEKTAEYIGMKEIGDDNVRIFFFDDLLKMSDSRDVKETIAVDCFYCNAGRYECRSKFTKLFQGDDFVFEAVKQRKCPEHHIFTSAIPERLDDMEDFFLGHIRI